MGLIGTIGVMTPIVPMSHSCSPTRFLRTVREMILRVDTKSLRRGIRWACLLFLLAASIQWMGATAPAQAVDARVASVNGTALRRNNQRAFILARGDSLNPGDEVDTRGGGRVVIELTDGSVVVVHPNSRIVISDYRAAASLREMFRILIGRVRVKVAHFGGKPNPYRVNSPTASILVRGTEFGVAAESSGDTRVEVYDGLVEVQSLSDPRRRVFLSKGRGALVKPNEDIRFFTPGSGNRTDERGGGNDGAGLNADNDADTNGNANANGNAGGNANANANGNAGGNANARANANPNGNAGGNVNTNANAHANLKTNGNANARANANANGNAAGKLAAQPTGDNNQTRDDLAANATTSVSTYLTKDYDKYVDGLAGRGWSIPLQRFSAFADSHFDSLDNPAYSTEFTSIEGRAWLIPFFNKARGGDLKGGPAGFPIPGNLISPFDSGLLAQFDFFIPLEKVRMVIGGAVAVSSDRSQSLSVDQAPSSLIRLLPGRGSVSRYVAVSTETTSITGSLVAARRFGDDGRTSVGVGVEWVRGGDDVRGQTSLANGARALAIEELEANSQIRRLRLRLGMTREFNGGHKLGLVYSNELATADDRDRSRLFAGRPLGLDSTRQEGRSSEISFRLRGPLSRRLFYGLEGALLWGESDGQIRRSFFTDSTTKANADGASAGFGVGYALRRATVLSADVAFGLTNVREGRREDATGNKLENRRESERFVSGRGGLQTDVWRRLFASASTLVVGYVVTTDIDLRPDRFGRRLTIFGLPELEGRSRRNSMDVFSDFGAGWRFKPNLLAEYVFSINNGLGPPRHIFLLRYTFKREE